MSCLSKLVESYNNAFRQSIGMTPVEVSNQKHENFVLQQLCGQGPMKPSPKFKLNNWVCVSCYCGVFDKEYLPSWSEEYYQVIEIENTKPLVYKLCDMQDEV